MDEEEEWEEERRKGGGEGGEGAEGAKRFSSVQMYMHQKRPRMGVNDTNSFSTD